MKNLQHRLLVRTLLASSLVAGIAFAATPLLAQDPPPSEGRLSHLQGNISVQPNGSDDWDQASNNSMLGAGDRVFADQDGRGALQAGPTREYFGPNADLSLVTFDNNGIELGQAQGAVVYASDGFYAGQSLFVSTPNGAVNVPSRARFRIDIYRDQNTTVISNFDASSALTITGAGNFQTVLYPNQSIQIWGTNPLNSQQLEPAVPDEFQHWSLGLESHRYNSETARYVSAEMSGYEDLDGNGDWQPESPYGPIWYPHVDRDWQPYHYGHWVHRFFFGWTWVADEPWGAAPFHYGRWVRWQGRWGWLPGPREEHPVWSPAQVVFAGGIRVGGAGVSAWFPLGPGEAYKPWYPCSQQYIDRVNISNIRESREVHVQKTYVNIVNVTNVTYINRTNVTVMRQEDFAAGRAAHQTAIHVDPAQLQHIQVAAPVALAPAKPIILHPIARPVNIPVARPVLINQNGQAVAAVPNAKPVAVPVKPVQVAPVPNGNQPPRMGSENGVAPMHPLPPVIPGHPQQPGQQPVTGQPIRPQTPNQPGQPPANGQPVRPQVPNQPTQPPVQVQPARPQVPPQPNQPLAPQQPARPQIPQPTQPVAPPAPQQPVRPVPPPPQIQQPIRPTPPPPAADRPMPQQPMRPVPPPQPQQPARPTPPPVENRPAPPPPPPPAVRPTPPPPASHPAPAADPKKDEKKKPS